MDVTTGDDCPPSVDHRLASPGERSVESWKMDQFDCSIPHLTHKVPSVPLETKVRCPSDVLEGKSQIRRSRRFFNREESKRNCLLLRGYSLGSFDDFTSESTVFPGIAAELF